MAPQLYTVPLVPARRANCVMGFRAASGNKFRRTPLCRIDIAGDAIPATNARISMGSSVLRRTTKLAIVFLVTGGVALPRELEALLTRPTEWIPQYVWGI